VANKPIRRGLGIPDRRSIIDLADDPLLQLEIDFLKAAAIANDGDVVSSHGFLTLLQRRNSTRSGPFVEWTEPCTAMERLLLFNSS
jgi:hypothetical protein